MLRTLGPSLLQHARARLARGGVLAYPTESCFGLGCHPASATGLRRILALKRRPMHKGMIVVGANWAQLAPYVAPLNREQQARLADYWPGPVTLLLPASRRVLPLLRGRHRKLAVRITAHPETARLCRLLGSALVSTSANLTGQCALKTGRACQQTFGHAVSVLPGHIGKRRKPSTIIDFATGRVLR